MSCLRSHLLINKTLAPSLRAAPGQIRSRWQIQACHAEMSLPFLRRLNDDHLVPSVKLLERQQETYALMRMAQHDILSTLVEELNVRPQATRVSKDGLTVYNTPDGSLSIALQVGTGEGVGWLVASTTALVKFGGGTIRINVFPDQTVSVPKLDIELFYFFGRINMYVNFVARTDLVLDDEYLTRYYKTKGSAGHSIHDLQLECMGDPEMSPFESRSIDMRVLTGQTSLFQGATATLDNVQNMITYAKRAVALWLEFAKAEDSAVTTQAQAEDLLRHDRALYGFAWRDPDNEKVSALIGEDALREMLQLSTRDASILAN
ncbi:g351 [Coccomyxa elongata]